MEVFYTAEATATGGRRAGRATSPDGVLDLPIAPPKEVGGPGGATNPEQLFAAGYAACFDNALGSIARRAKVDVGKTSVTARVGLGRAAEGGYGLEVELRVSVPGVPSDQAEELVAKAHQLCPYSRATRGNIEVRLTVV
jgi:lipoyl-dependent peroxiredoxin